MGVFRATVDLDFPIGSGRGTNTWTLRTAGAFDDAAVDTLMGYVREFYEDFQTAMPPSYSWSWDGAVQELGSVSPGFYPAGGGWTVTGSLASEQYTAAAAMACVTWYTAVATRSGRGRTFIGPLPAGLVAADGTLNTVNLTEFRLAAADLVNKSKLFAGDGAIAVWSEKDQVARDIVLSGVTDQVAILRSRRG